MAGDGRGKHPGSCVTDVPFARLSISPPLAPAPSPPSLLAQREAKKARKRAYHAENAAERKCVGEGCNKRVDGPFRYAYVGGEKVGRICDHCRHTEGHKWGL